MKVKYVHLISSYRIDGFVTPLSLHVWADWCWRLIKHSNNFASKKNRGSNKRLPEATSSKY